MKVYSGASNLFKKLNNDSDIIGFYTPIAIWGVLSYGALKYPPKFASALPASVLLDISIHNKLGCQTLNPASEILEMLQKINTTNSRGEKIMQNCKFSLLC